MISDHIARLIAEIDARDTKDANLFAAQEDSIRSMIRLFTLALLVCRPEFETPNARIMPFATI